jgi:hypothetical protein
MTERRYRDPEVRKILELATRPETASPPAASGADGLTLAEIQGIAGEVGIPADAVSRAAAALEARAAEPRRSWGMPVEVGRTVPLPRPLTDAEWERLVAELRTTFRARGRIDVDGGLRQWSNGNLHVAVEPGENGYRLRMGTLKGGATEINGLGLAGVVTGGALLGASALTGGGIDLAAPLMLGAGGIAAFLANLVRLPRWASERSRQMAHIEAWMRSNLQASSDSTSPPPDA